MNTPFQFVALPRDRFAALFSMSDAEPQAVGARRMVADEKPGFPCRVSLVDAEAIPGAVGRDDHFAARRSGHPMDKEQMSGRHLLLAGLRV